MNKLLKIIVPPTNIEDKAKGTITNLRDNPSSKICHMLIQRWNNRVSLRLVILSYLLSVLLKPINPDLLEISARHSLRQITWI